MKTIKVSDLKDQIGMTGPRPFLYCEVCGNEASANASDYFMARKNYIFECCDVPMLLVTSNVVYKEVK